MSTIKSVRETRRSGSHGFEKHGIAAERLSSKGFGKSHPLVPNNEEHN